MATYNGEKYIKKQIESILLNLNEADELVISDDGSTDNTINIIIGFMKNDKRINLVNGPKLGIKQNFANAIDNSTGKYIFLSDQDDIWMENKKEIVIETFKKEKCTLVIHDAEIVDENLNIINESFFNYRNCGEGYWKNICKNTYIGCCMAFSKELKDKILPIPNNIQMHDQWIGIINDIVGKSCFLHKTLIRYRRHNSNNSQLKHNPVLIMIKNRIILIFELARRIF